jgi:hypothetical protein
MSRMHRGAMWLVLGALVGGTVATAQAQVTGMPLFTNPRFGTGFRIHADIGQPADQGTQPGNLTVIQGGVTLALGPIGLGANLGALKNSINSIKACTSNPPIVSSCNSQTKFTGSGLAQLRLMGGGLNPISLSLFGGASMDVNAYDMTKYGFHPVTHNDSVVVQALKDSLGVKELTIPVGAAIGVHIPLIFTSLNLWGAPRLAFHKFSNCTAANSTLCGKTTSTFRWAVGVDIPLLWVISLRAAYDSGKIDNKTVNYWGIGASIGLGGMR